MILPPTGIQSKIEPHGYLTGTLKAIANGHKQKDIGQLPPWSWGVAG